MKIMSFNPANTRVAQPQTRQVDRPLAPSVVASAPRFGALCPICLTLLAGGIGAGVAMLRKMSNQKGNQYSLHQLYGKDLGNQLLAKLEQLEAKQPGIIKTFMENPEAGSATLMTELGEDLTQKLQAVLEAKRNK